MLGGLAHSCCTSMGSGRGVVVAVDDHHGGDWCTMLQLNLFTCNIITQKIFLAVHFKVYLYPQKKIDM